MAIFDLEWAPREGMKIPWSGCFTQVSVYNNKNNTRRRLVEVYLESSHVQYVNKNFQRKTVNIFIPIIFSICFGCSKEPSH